MKFSRTLAVLIAAAAVSLPAVAQDQTAAKAPALTVAQARTVDGLIDAGLDDDLAWDILESITTEIGPRLGGSPAEARARDWGAAKLKALGFKNVRIETFEMP